MAKQYGMVIDTTRCMGCQTCAVACKVSNEVPGDIYWAHVEGLDGDVYRPTGTFPQVKMNFRPTLCNHCAEPACAANCPTGAMAKREDNGAVVVDQEVCIGCGTCLKTCTREGVTADERGIHVHKDREDDWDRIIYNCPTGAIAMDARTCTVQELVREAQKDCVFYRRGSGGVTISGGEPLMQADFAAGLLAGAVALFFYKGKPRKKVSGKK